MIDTAVEWESEQPKHAARDDGKRDGEDQDPAAAERLKSPKKSRPSVTIAPSTTPGPDVRVRQPR